jgi:hypothetical protein
VEEAIRREWEEEDWNEERDRRMMRRGTVQILRMTN